MSKSNYRVSMGDREQMRRSPFLSPTEANLSQTWEMLLSGKPEFGITL